jgi:tungstate transport system substrate-binding protein
MHNDFVIVGPSDDPARIRNLTAVNEAMRAIAGHGAFVSRGDESALREETGQVM